MSDPEAIEAFEVRVPDEVLADLHERLVDARFPDAIDGSGWDYGSDLAYLRELRDYWRDAFDWREQEARINRMPQYTTVIDGLRVHFVHARSQDADAFPVVVSHGWPGGVVEFADLVEPLRAPEAHGARAGDAFHVVCPSIPGYGFSQPATEPGMNPARVAAVFAKLMQRLGYGRYGAQGGDWGSEISSCLGALDPEHCAAVHLNLVLAGPPRDGSDPMAGLSEAEKAHLALNRQNGRSEMGYAAIQGTKPQTIGSALNDSPIGLAAWIVEKFRAWSDCDGDVEKRFTKDQLLTNITLYWATQSANSAGRLYYEMTHGERVPRSQVPTGCALFPAETMRAPRAWAERKFNVVHWTEMPRGGHFAAMEEPLLLAADMRRFFARFR